ncbi:MAG: hypothetical protein JWQ02_2495 [Capsulimonas sp.]|nr:hypothetical protein [Capsulimonas sp.]
MSEIEPAPVSPHPKKTLRRILLGNSETLRRRLILVAWIAAAYAVLLPIAYFMLWNHGGMGAYFIAAFMLCYFFYLDPASK